MLARGRTYRVFLTSDRLAPTETAQSAYDAYPNRLASRSEQLCERVIEELEQERGDCWHDVLQSLVRPALVAGQRATHKNVIFVIRPIQAEPRQAPDDACTCPDKLELPLLVLTHLILSVAAIAFGSDF